jgi:hypothetical protein
MRARIGILLLLVVIVVVVAFSVLNRGGGGSGLSGGPVGGGASVEPITLKGYIGGEKINFVQDPDIVKILQEKYGITLDAEKRGSLEMVTEESGGKDFLWPSNEIALSMYKQKNSAASADTIFNSPIVIYSWDKVTDALIKLGVVKLENGAYYIVDTRKLIDLMDRETTWEKIGLGQLHGKILVYSTDPGKSSSGQLFSALLADSLTGDEVSDPKKLNAVLPTIKRFFDKQGLMRESSKDLFEEFLSRGMGNKQLVIGYEAQLVEYNIENPQVMSSRQNAVRTLYPRPTVWSAHPVIALNGNARRLITALKDPQIQDIAWRKHGFRSATGAPNDPKTVGVPGIPVTIDNIVQLPAPGVMQTIENKIEGK